MSDASFITTDNVEARHAKGSNGDATPAATLTPRPATASSNASPSVKASVHNHAQAAHHTAYALEGVPPVPPIPDSLRDKSVSPTGQTEAQDFARPKTAPNGNAVKKSRSVKSGVSRGRSGDRRHRGSEVQGKKPDFSGFLSSIGVDDDEDEDLETALSGSARGAGKAPY